MKKLYEKNEIFFALAWILIYVLGIGNLKSAFGLDSLWPMLGLLALSVVMFLFVRRSGLLGYYGLAGWAKNSSAMLWFLPLWLLSCINLFGGFGSVYTVPGLIYAAVSMLLVGFVEELLFRGFLFKAMLRDGSVTTAVIVSSVSFGLGHIVNLFSGQDLGTTLNQMVFAIAAGFVFTLVFYKSGSLLPGILAHSFIDVSSVFAADEASQRLNLIVHVVFLVVSAAYCIYLVKRVEPPAVNRAAP